MKTDKRKYMTDREILEKYINLDNACFTKKEKEEVMDIIYKYKEAFSLIDEIGTLGMYILLSLMSILQMITVL